LTKIVESLLIVVTIW